ncbi:UNVERIFIED_CONTAM: Transmembrane emp24 domain-containing protein p24beta3 [Sesamum angustifolium]|uniref:Transmembrane emp24 domain-containing protein p24beta3 n=1 Tax=Sesamum angustifolium TaxID=2727405 RepID=A0AAW2NYU0_9LAMI
MEGSGRITRSGRSAYALLGLLFLSLVSRSSALSVTVNDIECVYEYVLYEGDTVSGNFVVVDHDIFWSSDHPGIDFTVTSPAGNTVHTLKGTSGDKFEFKAPRSGMYKFCFHNPYSTPETVSFYIHVGHIPTEHDLAKDEHLDPINVKLAELREALESVTAEQKYLKARDARHRHISHRWLMPLSILQTNLIVSSSQRFWDPFLGHPGRLSTLLLLVFLSFCSRTSLSQSADIVMILVVMDLCNCCRDIFFVRHRQCCNLKQQYGLSKTANEVIIVIEAYRTLRDRGPYPADQVVRDIQGKFAFALFDTTSKATFIASDADGAYFSEGNVVVSDDSEVVKQGCGKSFAPFPKGCFFTSSGGLRSYEHPVNELKAVPRVDSSGEVCGLTFKVDEASRKEKAGMPRVGSDANWSQNY